MFREHGLRGGVLLLAATGFVSTSTDEDAMRDRVLRTDVKKGGAAWMDGKRKP
jgi:hypothetical protein